MYLEKPPPYLTSKWEGTIQYFQHKKKHEENIKWEIIVFLIKK